MKEVTYEEWQKNPTPRMMWVWDNNEHTKVQRKVIYFLDPKLFYPVVVLSEDERRIDIFRHCVEIEEVKTRRMTYKELSRWLREKPTREFKYKDNNFIYHWIFYSTDNQDKEVADDILIREDDGEWREPLVKIEE